MKSTGKLMFVAALVGLVTWFVARGVRDETPVEVSSQERTQVRADPVELESSHVVEAEASAGVERKPTTEAPATEGNTTAATHVLRVVLKGITQEELLITRLEGRASMVEGGWAGFDVLEAWVCTGLTSTFGLDAMLERLRGDEELRTNEFWLRIEHPHHARKIVSVSLEHGVEQADGQVVHEVEVELVPPVFWPEMELSVKDADTREHLSDVELRFAPSAYMGMGQLPEAPGVFTLFGEGFHSPIAFRGGRDSEGDPGWVSGLALRPEADQKPRMVSLFQVEAIDRGVMMYAWSPGYAWGRSVLDISLGADREILLRPGANLRLAFRNVQFEQYAALEKSLGLHVNRVDEEGEESWAWYETLEERSTTDGVVLEGLEEGEYVVRVELGFRYGRKQNDVLFEERLQLAAGRTRELVLALEDPPEARPLTSLSGRVTFPTFEREDEVRLLLFDTMTYHRGGADVDVPMGQLERVPGSPPAWAFQFDELPAGLYQAQLYPLMSSWMIELPDDGLHGVELTVDDFAEVQVEVVDAHSGERVPVERLRHGSLEPYPGEIHFNWTHAHALEPGLFKFWSRTGAAYVQATEFRDENSYGVQDKKLNLVSGPQSIRFELQPYSAFRIEFHVDGKPLPRDDDIWVGLAKGIQGVGHDGRVSANRLPNHRMVELSQPGLYELNFDGVRNDRFQPILPQSAEARAGEVVDVIVELRRK